MPNQTCRSVIEYGALIRHTKWLSRVKTHFSIAMLDTSAKSKVEVLVLCKIEVLVLSKIEALVLSKVEVKDSSDELVE